MATSKRDLIKRKHTAIENALVRALGWTCELEVQFQEHHPEYSKGYQNISIMIVQAHDFIKKMKGYI